MKVKIVFVIFAIIILSGIAMLAWGISQRKSKDGVEEAISSEVKLWGDCDPDNNKCQEGLECNLHEVTGLYKCMKYLEEGEECGKSEAEVCKEGLNCVDTDETRQRCGVFSRSGGEECISESLQVCK